MCAAAGSSGEQQRAAGSSRGRVEEQHETDELTRARARQGQLRGSQELRNLSFFLFYLHTGVYDSSFTTTTPTTPTTPTTHLLHLLHYPSVFLLSLSLSFFLSLSLARSLSLSFARSLRSLSRSLSSLSLAHAARDDKCLALLHALMMPIGYIECHGYVVFRVRHS